MSPSGVKMRKVIEQKISKSPSGYDLITQKIKWEPFEEDYEEQELAPDGKIISTKKKFSPKKPQISKQTFIISPQKPQKTSNYPNLKSIAHYHSQLPQMIEKQIQTSIPCSPQRIDRAVSPRRSPNLKKRVRFSPIPSPNSQRVVHLSSPQRIVSMSQIHPPIHHHSVILIKDPKQNIQVPKPLKKVISDNPDAYNPLEGRENHELKQLKEINIPNPELRKKKGYTFESKLKPGDIGIQCPIEDPRNPYHHEYLKLKATKDGHLKEDSLKENRFKGEKNPKSPGRKKIWDSEEMNNLDMNGSKTPFNSKSQNRKGNALLDPPLPEVRREAEDPKEVDKYHYCDDCDVAFKTGDLLTSNLPQAQVVHSYPFFEERSYGPGQGYMVSSPARMVYGRR